MNQEIEKLKKEIKNLKEEEFVLLINELLKFSEEEMKKLAFKQKYEIPSHVSIIKEYKDTKKVPLGLSANRPSICDILLKRKSEREYSDIPLSISELSTLLIYSYGIRSFSYAYNYSNFPFRTAPSGGGLQSVEVYCVVNQVDSIEEGLYHFDPINNSLDLIFNGFCKGKLLELCRGQEFISGSAVVFILTMILSKRLWKYSPSYYKIALIDIGCVAENIHLLATAMGLGSCLIAGFDSDNLSRFLRLNDKLEIPALMISIGKK